MTPIPPTERLAVTLEAQQWNAVIAVLSEAPYRVAAPLIGEIQRQCMAVAATLARGNGTDADPPFRVTGAIAEAETTDPP